MKYFRIFIALLILLLYSSPAFAAFTITSPSSASFEGRNVSTSEQNTTVTISGVTVNDDRGGSPGWTATIAVTHMTIIRPATLLAGSNNTVSSSGSYDGTFGVSSPVKQYVLTITQAGSVGTARFDVSGAETNTNVLTGSQVVIGSKGVRADFDVANYQVNDQWIILVDVFPYTAMSVSPGSITVNSGSGANVSAGSGGTLTGTGDTSNTMTIMSALAGYGTGNYSQNETITMTIHQNSLQGNYSAVATFTVT